MSKNLDYTILFDIYSPLLTDKQRDTLDLYYNEDLSLGEISESTGVTRQAVMNCIKKSEARLDELEEKMGLVQRFMSVSEYIGKLKEIICEEEFRNKNKAEEYLKKIDELL